MQLTVSLTLDLPTSELPDIVALETAVWQAGREGMGRLLAAAVRALETCALTCPVCGAAAPKSRGTKPRVLLTRFGRVELRLRRLCCRACAHRWRPAAVLLAPLGDANVTPALHDACVLAGASWSFAQAAEVLHELSGAQVSAETVRQHSEAAGTALAQTQAAAAEAATTLTAAAVRAERAAALSAPPAPPAAPPPRALIGLDGGWVPSKDQAGGMEGKLAVLSTGAVPVGRHGRQRLTPRRYAGSFGGATELGPLSYVAGAPIGATQAQEQVVLGDGAEWIKTVADDQFPESVRILDWAHLARKVHGAIRAARPGAGRRAERRTLHEEVSGLLWQGQREAALARLRELRPPGGEGVKGLEEAIRYLEEQAEWIGDYAAWQAAGYPVGSGLVERAVAVVINRRLKRRGGRWWRKNANAILVLRVERFNRDAAATELDPAA